MRDRLSGITAFVNAAEAGSFALAAERMHLSRSAVGKTIARLEGYRQERDFFVRQALGALRCERR